jgi:hypothetical protein
VLPGLDYGAIVVSTGYAKEAGLPGLFPVDLLVDVLLLQGGHKKPADQSAIFCQYSLDTDSIAFDVSG